MSILSSNNYNKLEADDINFVREFINMGIDANIFNLTTCKTFECFELLIVAGCKVTGMYDMSNVMKTWKLEEVICAVGYLMDNDAIKSNFNLDREIFYFAGLMTNTRQENTELCKMIVSNYPWLKISATTCVRYYWCAEVFEPIFDFNSKELVEEFLKVNGFPPVSLLIKYCEPCDFFTAAVFQKVFRRGDIDSMNSLLELGYTVVPESFPETLWHVHIVSFEHLKSIGLWDGQTFNWENHECHTNKASETKFRKWLQENHCPEHIIEKIATIKN
jgi:hypothetical protein